MPKKFVEEKKEKKWKKKCGIRMWEGGAGRERSLRATALGFVTHHLPSVLPPF
jgi:hypothetical protein